MLEMDKYYTPQCLAERILDRHFQEPVDVCVDTTCGGGNLLKAAKIVYGNISCVGLDLDKKAVDYLKKCEPNWILSVADLLKESSYKKARAFNEFGSSSDLLLLNPPFSHKGRKSVYLKYSNEKVKASVAMAYILRSLELFDPKIGAMIVVPESVLYSETDIYARQLLSEKYSVNLITELGSNTFSQARVNTSIVKLNKLSRDNGKSFWPLESPKIMVPRYSKLIKANIIRGALPVHLAKKSSSRNSSKYIHTTDIRQLVLSPNLTKLNRTAVIRKGKVEGNVILMPRVGNPIVKLLYPLFLDEEHQLSDCVIALKFNNYKMAKIASNRIIKNFEELQRVYRGTAARYISLTKLTDWLRYIRIKVT